MTRNDNMRSSMFLNQPTVIDHAYIDNEGYIVGGSFNPCFTISGKVDPVEKVVVDFSTVKKSLKAAIDDRENGFDHKLWILPQWSNCAVTQLNGDMLHIVTPHVTLDLPSNAVKFLHHAADYSLNSCGNDLRLYLDHALGKVYPDVEVSILVKNSQSPQLYPLDDDDDGRLDFQNIEFRYQHGLKDSTSWGCQSLAHGHLSFIQLFYRHDLSDGVRDRDDTDDDVHFLLERMKSYIDGATFINTENIAPAFVSGNTAIEYTTERGFFRAEYDRSCKLIVLNTETTIEYIVEHVVEHFREDLKTVNASHIFVSEGLSKGAVIQL